jgi:hypothetical protein
MQFDIGMLFVVIGISTCSPNTCYRTWLPMTPSIATKFQYVNSLFLFDILELCCDWRRHRRPSWIDAQQDATPKDKKHVIVLNIKDRLCGLVVRVLGYRSGGPGSIPGTTGEKKVVGLERGALSLVSTTEEILDRKVAATVWKTENTAVGIRHADHLAPSSRKSCQSLRRQAAVAQSV